MKLLSLLLLALVIGCTPLQPKDPTPFSSGEKIADPYGCKLLKQEVEEYNKNHSNKKIADC